MSVGTALNDTMLVRFEGVDTVAGMNARHFLAEVLELLRMQLPGELKEFESVGPWHGLIKVHYGDPSAHYELHIQRRHQQIELGLHFEGAAQDNTQHLESLMGRVGEIKQRLGPEVEAEQWTRNWTRVHETIEFQPLDEDFLMELTARLSQYIRVLEPMVEEA